MLAVLNLLKTFFVASRCYYCCCCCTNFAEGLHFYYNIKDEDVRCDYGSTYFWYGCKGLWALEFKLLLLLLLLLLPLQLVLWSMWVLWVSCTLAILDAVVAVEGVVVVVVKVVFRLFSAFVKLPYVDKLASIATALSDRRNLLHYLRKYTYNSPLRLLFSNSISLFETLPRSRKRDLTATHYIIEKLIVSTLWSLGANHKTNGRHQ